ncbi:MAG: glutamate racemase, partial [Flavobacteriaceae bacterium]
MRNSPIGVFDSGVGGLSVLQALRTRLPNEDVIYVADQAFAPYG